MREHLLNIKNKQNRLGFMPFWLAGYPNIDESIKVMKTLLKYGDVLEVGIPFSDPSADGPTIQTASKLAINNGFNTNDAFYCIKNANNEFGKKIVILCYLNTIIQYGIDQFFKCASESGVSTVLIPDLPPEESDLVKKYSDNHSVSLAYIISTNTSMDRVNFIDSVSNSFIYFVSKPSITGVTNNDISKETIDYINKVKGFIKNPLYIGFGISSKAQVDQYAKSKADGFIIGSKLISLKNSIDVENFCKELAIKV